MGYLVCKSAIKNMSLACYFRLNLRGSVYFSWKTHYESGFANHLTVRFITANSIVQSKSFKGKVNEILFNQTGSKKD